MEPKYMTNLWCHAPRGRVSRNVRPGNIVQQNMGHAPRGRVSRNFQFRTWPAELPGSRPSRACE